MSWAKDFYKEHRETLTALSVIRLGLVVTGYLNPSILRIRLKAPRRTVGLRADTPDLFTFEDVFIRQIYGPAFEQSVGTFIDLGANIGLASLYAQSRNGSCRILAVEPDPQNLRRLREHLGGADKIIEGAVWHTTGPVTFAPDTPTTGAVTRTGTGLAVQGYTMSDLIDLSGFPTVDLLKIDIEGFERELFSGEATWLSRVRALVAEFHGTAREDSDFDALMSSYDFVVTSTPDATIAVRRQ